MLTILTYYLVCTEPQEVELARIRVALERRLRDEKSKSRRLELEMHDVQARTSDVWAWCVV